MVLKPNSQAYVDLSPRYNPSRADGIDGMCMAEPRGSYLHRVVGDMYGGSTLEHVQDLRRRGWSLSKKRMVQGGGLMQVPALPPSHYTLAQNSRVQRF